MKDALRLYRGRCVREDVRIQEEWLNPGGDQHWDSAKLVNEIRRADERRLCSMIIVAGRDKCNRTSVIDSIGVWMNALMKLRRNTQQQRPEKRRTDDGRNNRATAICRARRDPHRRRACSRLTDWASNFSRRYRLESKRRY